MARTFSTSQLPKVVRSRCVSCILTSTCASRHNGVQFFISLLARWLRTDGSAPVALANLLFDPTEPQTIGKTQCFAATFLPFRAPGSSFFWLFFFSDLLSSTLLFSLALPVSAFHLSILSEVWLLNFLWSISPFNLSSLKFSYSKAKSAENQFSVNEWLTGWSGMVGQKSPDRPWPLWLPEPCRKYVSASLWSNIFNIRSS